MIPEARNFFRVYFPQNCSTITFSLCKYYSRSLLSTLTIFFSYHWKLLFCHLQIVPKNGNKKKMIMSHVSQTSLRGIEVITENWQWSNIIDHEWPKKDRFLPCHSKSLILHFTVQMHFCLLTYFRCQHPDVWDIFVWFF